VYEKDRGGHSHRAFPCPVSSPAFHSSPGLPIISQQLQPADNQNNLFSELSMKIQRVRYPSRAIYWGILKVACGSPPNSAYTQPARACLYAGRDEKISGGRRKNQCPLPQRRHAQKSRWDTKTFQLSFRQWRFLTSWTRKITSKSTLPPKPRASGDFLQYAMDDATGAFTIEKKATSRWPLANQMKPLMSTSMAWSRPDASFSYINRPSRTMAPLIVPPSHRGRNPGSSSSLCREYVASP